MIVAALQMGCTLIGATVGAATNGREGFRRGLRAGAAIDGTVISVAAFASSVAPMHKGYGGFIRERLSLDEAVVSPKALLMAERFVVVSDNGESWLLGGDPDEKKYSKNDDQHALPMLLAEGWVSKSVTPGSGTKDDSSYWLVIIEK